MPKLYSRIGTFRQLEILLAVYQAGSITGASKKLSVAANAFLEYVKDYERESMLSQVPE